MRFTRSDTLKIGGKPVQVRKITIAQWRELFSVVQTLPEILLGIMTAPAGSRMAYLLAMIDHTLDDTVRVVAVLTGLDAEWIEANAALDELVAYIIAVARVNDFGTVLKNVQGALSLTGAATETPPEQSAN